MSRKPGVKGTAAEGTHAVELQRIHVRRDGYDATGAYWGAGHDVFIARFASRRSVATTSDGTEEVTVRARNVSEARKKIADVLARAPGETSPDRDKLGGASPHTSRYEIKWQDPAAGTSVRIGIKHSRDYLGMGQDHVEIESIAPKKAPLPITETGYKSHFLPALDLVNAGGPVTFVTAWLNREASGKAWRVQASAKAQGDLFQWAATKGEIGKRKVSPRRADGKPSRRQKQRRDPA
jgi:hypothetical protein